MFVQNIYPCVILFILFIKEKGKKNLDPDQDHLQKNQTNHREIATCEEMEITIKEIGMTGLIGEGVAAKVDLRGEIESAIEGDQGIKGRGVIDADEEVDLDRPHLARKVIVVLLDTANQAAID